MSWVVLMNRKNAALPIISESYHYPRHTSSNRPFHLPFQLPTAFFLLMRRVASEKEVAVDISWGRKGAQGLIVRPLASS